MANKLAGKNIAIIATDDVEEAEILKPKQALEKEGATTVVIAPHKGTIQAVKHDEKTTKIPVNATLDEALADDFDAVLLPGGALNADQLRMNEAAQEFVTTMDEDGKPLAVICHGPWLLVSAGIVNGRRLTSYHTMQDDIQNAGADWIDSEVVVDDNWVSSRQPSDIPAFNTAMINLFAAPAEIEKIIIT